MFYFRIHSRFIHVQDSFTFHTNAGPLLVSRDWDASWGQTYSICYFLKYSQPESTIGIKSLKFCQGTIFDQKEFKSKMVGALLRQCNMVNTYFHRGTQSHDQSRPLSRRINDTNLYMMSHSKSGIDSLTVDSGTNLV